jgi:hypothetical protein
VYDSTGPIYGKGEKTGKNGKTEKVKKWEKVEKLEKSVPHRVYRIGHPSHLRSQAIFPRYPSNFSSRDQDLFLDGWTAFFQFFPFFQVYDIGGG